MTSLPYAAAIVVAAGRSARMGDGPRKPLRDLAGRTVLQRALSALAAAPAVGELIVVGRADDEAALREAAGDVPVAAFVEGGAERTDSVRAGLAAVSDDIEVVLVHDAARPLVTSAHVDEVARVARETGGALLAVPVRDTLHRARDGRAREVVPRADLWAAQTPQGFRRAELADAFARAARDGRAFTDDAALWQHYVGPVRIVEGSPGNLKLTTADDMVIARALLAAREENA